jgi:hypothetical protein
MLSDGNGKGSFEGVYERARLRRMARKLGLRLVKSNPRRPQPDSGFGCTTQGVGSNGSRTDAAEGAMNPLADLDKCG